MNRVPTELENQLEVNDTLDVPARQAALIAVKAMMDGATRSGQLLAAARKATTAAATGSGATSALQQNAAALAQRAYTERTNAEVAKYRAAYALMAEQHGQTAVLAAHAAQAATDAMARRPFLAAAKYHGKVRDLMMAASAATAKALQQVPPLPSNITGQARVGPQSNVAQGGGEQLLAQPTYGWRPKKYSELMAPFFPANYKLAAGSLSGVHGVSLGSALGTADATTDMPTGDTWWSNLTSAVGFGVRATGTAAAVAGQQVASSHPEGGSALSTTGTVLSTLSNLLGQGVSSGTATMPAQDNSGTALLVIGLLAVGGFAAWKLTK